jgi:membrane protease YdiL (CAAX protease family)
VRILFTKSGFTTGSVASDFLPDLFKSNVLFYFFTIITAGVTEELLIRGYLQPRLEKIFKNSIVGIICSAVFFGLLHLGHGTFYYVVNTFCIGLVFAFFYYKFKNIKILIIVHIIWDFLGLLRYL